MHPPLLRKVGRKAAGEARFSILIPTWNNLPYLQLCLDSIRRHSHFPHQLIVMINEGSDGTLEWVDAQPDLDYVFSPANIGVCYGLNACRALVRTGYLAYVNDDMYLLPGWDRALWREIEAVGHDRFLLSGTMIEPQPSDNECVLVRDYGDDLASFREADLLRDYASLDKADWAGSTWPPNLLPVGLWDLVGGMSTEFSPGMYSDPDLSMKLWQAGVRYFKGVGDSRVYHFASKSTGRVKKNDGRKLFLKKWGMTSSFFTSRYLRRGAPFTRPLSEPVLSAGDRWKNKLKGVMSGF